MVLYTDELELKCGRKQLFGHVARREYRCWWGKLLRKWSLEGWEDNINIYLGEVGCVNG
jgi:hypothetical protein